MYVKTLRIDMHVSLLTLLNQGIIFVQIGNIAKNNIVMAHLSMNKDPSMNHLRVKLTRLISVRYTL